MKTPGLVINLRKDGRVGEIDIYGTIGGSWDGSGVTPSQFKRDLESLGDLDRLNVHVHSYGGFVYEGWAIFTALDTHKAEVHVYVDGAAMSMASVILMAADVKHIAKNGTVMIHNPISISFGDASDFRKAADELDRITNQIIDAYIEGGVKATRDEIVAMMNEETYFSAEEAVKLGFADIIGEESEEAGDPAATANALIHAHLSTMSGLPANLMETVNMTQPAISPGQPGSITPENVEAARKEAAAAAHKRYSDIMALSRPGLETFVKDLADNQDITAADAKIKVADEMFRIQSTNFDRSRTDRNAPVQPENPAAIPANSLQERWEKNEGGVRDSFLDFDGFKAYEQANSAGLIKLLGSK